MKHGQRLIGGVLRDVVLVMRTPPSPADPDWLSEAEAFDGAEELAAALESERWGSEPFGDGER